MFADLNAVVAACAVDQVLIVDVDRNVVNVQPAAALACATTVHITTIVLASARIEPCKEDQIACLKLRRIGEQTTHLLTLLRHTNRGQTVH